MTNQNLQQSYHDLCPWGIATRQNASAQAVSIQKKSAKADPTQHTKPVHLRFVAELYTFGRSDCLTYASGGQTLKRLLASLLERLLPQWDLRIA